MKRTFDFLAAFLGLVILLPVFALIALWIKWEGGGPVFFQQERVGKGGVTFRMLKFRSMVMNAEQLGQVITIGKDPRITRVGAILRATKADELPQLFNVLRGEMSLVGPRPEVPKYVAQYSPAERAILELRPGMTDPASLKYRDENDLLGSVENPQDYYVTVIVPDKIKVGLAYAQTATLWTDLQTILRTVGVIRY